jgi:SAM-dependent methyltransferase
MVDSKYDNLLNFVGLRQIEIDLFEKEGVGLYGTPFAAFCKARMNSRTPKYLQRLKQSTLPLSLYISSFFYRDRMLKLLSYLDGIDSNNISTVVELGCENGALTCAIAKLWPKAKVIGVDLGKNSINHANELKKNLKIENVSFVHADAHDYLKSAQSGSLDLIISACFLREFEIDRTHSQLIISERFDEIEEIKSTPSQVGLIEFLRDVAASLRDNGLFLSLDRLPSMYDYWRFIQCVEQTGLMTRLTESGRIDVETADYREILPLFVFEKKQPLGTTAVSELVSFAARASIKDQLGEVNEYLTEALYRSIKINEIRFRAVCPYFDGSGTLMIELIRSEALLMLRESTNRGFRASRFFSLDEEQVATNVIYEMLCDLKYNCDITVEIGNWSDDE